MFLELPTTVEKMNSTTPSAAILVRLDDVEMRERVVAAGRRFGATPIESVERLAATRAEAVVVVVDETAALQLNDSGSLETLPFAVAVVRVGDESRDVELETEPAEAGGFASNSAAETPLDLSLPRDVSDGEIRRMLVAACEIAGLRARLRQVHQVGGEWARLASTDPLTELPNRRGWNEWFARLVERAVCDERPLCVAVVDLDEFKQANDELGHSVGDDVLRTVAEALRSTIRGGDFCARLGGDEFGLLLAGLPEERVEPVFERIRSAATKLLAERGLPAVTCSFGYTMAKSSADEAINQLFDAADSALRQAKRDGRDRVRRSGNSA